MGAILFKERPRQLIQCIKFARGLTKCGLLVAARAIRDQKPPFIITMDLLRNRDGDVWSHIKDDPVPEQVLTPKALDDLCLMYMEAGEDVEILDDEEAEVFKVLGS